MTLKHKRLRALMLPAEHMYTGEQHRRLMRGLGLFRKYTAHDLPWKVDLWLISGGYGLISGQHEIAPYDCTFRSMSRPDLEKWARCLRIPERVRQVLAQPYDLGLILLGASYLRACALRHDVNLGGSTLLFLGSQAAEPLPVIQNLKPVILRRTDTRRFAAGSVGLKGELGARVLVYLIQDAGALAHLQGGCEGLLDRLAHISVE